MPVNNGGIPWLCYMTRGKSGLLGSLICRQSLADIFFRTNHQEDKIMHKTGSLTYIDNDQLFSMVQPKPSLSGNTTSWTTETQGVVCYLHLRIKRFQRPKSKNMFRWIANLLRKNGAGWDSWSMEVPRHKHHHVVQSRETNGFSLRISSFSSRNPQSYGIPMKLTD